MSQIFCQESCNVDIDSYVVGLRPSSSLSLLRQTKGSLELTVSLLDAANSQTAGPLGLQ